jgi:biopolymer transport protein ExbB/TolQ
MVPHFVQDYLRDGGLVLWLLLLLGAVLWTLIALRWSYLSRWSSGGRTVCPDVDPKTVLPLAYALFSGDEVKVRLGWGARWIRTLVVVAPLLGLLGTVSGMVETFSALAGNPDARASVAGGISEALVTTQFGLVLAIPGTMAGNWLDRRAHRLLQQIWSQRPEAP